MKYTLILLYDASKTFLKPGSFDAAPETGFKRVVDSVITKIQGTIGEFSGVLSKF